MVVVEPTTGSGSLLTQSLYRTNHKKVISNIRMNVKGQDTGIKPKLPITLLCGFLGAGKTTLLRHILQTQHGQKDKFRCAVIVNDMAALNIDKALIEDSALVQSDEVIEMQNGCVCCNLQSDLIGQIIELAQSGSFNYMIIEASGVSEPSQISKIFANQDAAACEEDHDHDMEHGPSLGDLARLDTCVTVVDCHDFLANTGDQRSLRIANNGSTWNTAKLMAEQIEYSNVAILNKTDLVLPEQLSQIQVRVRALNQKAKILTTSQAKPLEDIMEVVNTRLFNPKDFDFDSVDEWFQEQTNMIEEYKSEEPKSCCESSKAEGKTPCCTSLEIDSGLSRIFLGSSTEVSNEPLAKRPRLATRHEVRFSVTSFLYTSRIPFHPERFRENFLKKYFVLSPDTEREEGDDDSSEGPEDEGADSMQIDTQGQTTKEEIEAEKEEEIREQLEELQVEAAAKYTIRSDAFGGQLLRSKGFLWLANMHDLKMSFAQAGSMVKIEDGVIWHALKPGAWKLDNDHLRSTLRKKFHGPFADRRQELVFIGIRLQPAKIQQVLDECLLTKDEFDMGVDGWKATFGDSFLDELGQ